MFWFVNPYNHTEAINLMVTKYIKRDNNFIQFGSCIWQFPTAKKAKEVYESIIKEAQQTRYRKSSL